MSTSNSINENIYNATKSSMAPQHHVKRFLKPLLRLLRKTKSSTYRKAPQPEYEQEIHDNCANELLENEIFEEIDRCEDLAAVSVFNDGQVDIVPIFRGQRYIPVHFARTEAGTFFWTSMVGPDCDVNPQGDTNPITEHQQPQIQSAQRCRWAQA